MTIREALDKRVKFIRLPSWAPTAHIELPLLPNGQHGPWAIVRDPSGETPVIITTLLHDTEAGYEAVRAAQEEPAP